MQRIRCVFILIVFSIFVDLFESRSAVSVNRFGDVTVSNDGSTIRCDRLTCPVGTYRCQVTKIKVDINANFVERRMVCLTSTNQVLRENTIREPSLPGQREELNISVTSDGSITSSGTSSIGGSGGGGFGFGYGSASSSFGGGDANIGSSFSTGYGSGNFGAQSSNGYNSGVNGGYGSSSNSQDMGGVGGTYGANGYGSNDGHRQNQQRFN